MICNISGQKTTSVECCVASLSNAKCRYMSITQWKFNMCPLYCNSIKCTYSFKVKTYSK